MSKNLRTVYLRNLNKMPVGALVFNYDRDANMVYYGYSVNNPIDPWKRSLARQIAIGRLVETPNTVKVSKHSTNRQILRAVMADLSKYSNTPSRARKASLLWLKNDMTRVVKPRNLSLSVLDNIIDYKSPEEDLSPADIAGSLRS